jgi:hypothetical protein
MVLKHLIVQQNMPLQDLQIDLRMELESTSKINVGVYPGGVKLA